MSEKLLTIGMATYDDYDGVFFSVQALRIYQLAGLEDQVEILVIDNNPESNHGKEVKAFIENWAKGKYIAFTDKKSTTARNEIFKNAKGKYTLCIDCHVLLQPNAIKNLLEYYEKNPDTKNLIQGPLWYDDLKNISTHFEPVWRDSMYGIWATNEEAFKKGQAFEIPMMGLGMFSCKTSEWKGFNEKFKGFGGEEGYIHEKFRLAGGKCICLPNLKWNHRFGRPNGVPYPNILEDRIHNYIVGALENYGDENNLFFSELIEHFKDKKSKDEILEIIKTIK